MAIQDWLNPEKPETDKPPAQTYGDQRINPAAVVRVGAGEIAPHTIGDEHFAAIRPRNAVLVDVKPCSLAEADRAEDDAFEYEQGVKNALRLLKARGKEEQAAAALHTGRAAYLAVQSNATLQKAKANGRLASHLLAQRGEWAALGYGLERQIDTSTRQVNQRRLQYLGA